MNFSPCDITASNPLRSRYSLSAARRRNRRRKVERASLSKSSSRSLFIFLVHSVYDCWLPCCGSETMRIGSASSVRIAVGLSKREQNTSSASARGRASENFRFWIQ